MARGIPEFVDGGQLCPVCGGIVTSWETVAAEIAYVPNNPIPPPPGMPYAPVVDGSPMAPKQVPMRYDTTFQPCGHVVMEPPS